LNTCAEQWARVAPSHIYTRQSLLIAFTHALTAQTTSMIWEDAIALAMSEGTVLEPGFVVTHDALGREEREEVMVSMFVRLSLFTSLASVLLAAACEARCNLRLSRVCLFVVY
jgi:hypothetical protein